MMQHERPIIFGGWAIPKILNGTKTQTRRICKKAYDEFGESAGSVHPALVSGWISWWPGTGGEAEAAFTKRAYEYGWECPYGQIGDLLWIKENWRIGAWDEDNGTVAIDCRADGYCRQEWLTVPDSNYFERLWQQSTDDALAVGALEDEDGKFHWDIGKSPCHWRPSIFMPHWASRLTLTITSIRVERISDITLADALAEGCSSLGDFAQRWDMINGKRGYAFGTSSWVWVIGFWLKGVTDGSVKEGARVG